MVASIFKNYISKYLGGVAKKIVEKINGKPEDVVYEHTKYLKKEFSPDMKFSSLSTNTSIVAADVVALDSPLPLKKRGSYSSAEGEVPKLGMKKSMNESMLQQLKNLQARGEKEKQIVAKLFQDGVDIIKGVYERLDIMFLQALSTGVTVIDETDNTGTGIRIDFGVPAANQFGVVEPWKESDARPIDDIENVTSKARQMGYALRYIWMDKVTYNKFKANAQVKDAFAGYSRIPSANLFRLKNADLQEFITEEYGLTIIVIDKVVQVEKNGQKSSVEPWQRGNVVFTTSTDLGTLTWSELAEKDSPVKDVEYATVDDFILWSIFRTNDPLKENTSVQALAVPVLDNVDAIFIMDSNESLEVDAGEIEGDATITIYGSDLTKTTVISELETILDDEVDSDITDADLIKLIDTLSDEDEEALKTALGV